MLFIPLLSYCRRAWAVCIRRGEVLDAGMSVTIPFGNLVQTEERWRSYLKGVCAGDQGSFSLLYDETSSVLFGLALRILEDAAAAEDVMLNVYQEVWRSASDCPSKRGTVLGWLTALTRSRAIERLRRAPASNARGKSDAEFAGILEVNDRNSLFGDERKRMRHALAALASEEREAIELTFFRGLSDRELADTLGVPLNTIKTRVSGGMRKLREMLASTTPAESTD